MKPHRPWQPHMNRAPFFNPYAPTTEQNRTVDHIDIEDESEELEQEAAASGDRTQEQAAGEPPAGKQS